MSSMFRSASASSPATPLRRRKRALEDRTATRDGTRRSRRSRWRRSPTCSTLRRPMRLESRARSRALQALYAWDVRGERDLERIAGQVWDDLVVAPEERRLAGVIIRTIAASGDRIDDELTEVTTNWRLERLGAIERSV